MPIIDIIPVIIPNTLKIKAIDNKTMPTLLFNRIIDMVVIVNT